MPVVPPRDRALTRAPGLCHKLGGSMNLMDPMPAKPKWMRWAIYERRVATNQPLATMTLRDSIGLGTTFLMYI